MDEAIDLYLASRSPRRAELLRQLRLRFAVVAAEVDESPRPGEAPDAFVVRLAAEKARAGLAGLGRAVPAPVIGADSSGEGLEAGQMDWAHGFHLRHVRLGQNTATPRHVRHEEEVIFVYRGTLTVHLPDGTTELSRGDVLTVPIEMPRAYSNEGAEPVETYVVRGTDHPAPPTILT